MPPSTAAPMAPLDVADAHNDLLLACMHRRERGVRDPFGDDWLPQLRDGRVVLQVLPMFTEEQFIGEGALRRTLELIELAYDIAALHRHDVQLVTTAAELDEALAARRIALILALEGAEPIGSSVALFETMWRLGVRMASLTWNRRTMFADGIGERAAEGRLTTLGVEAIEEMNRLGMIVDISHLSAPGVAHLGTLTQSPVVATHSSCQALCGHPRNLTDDQLRAVIASGGFVGINAFGPFVGARSIDGYVDHFAHALRVAGDAAAGAMALGADFIVDLVRLVDPILGRNLLVELRGDEFIADFSRASDFPNVTAALVARFGAEQAARFASTNMIRFFAANLPAGS